MKKIVLAFVMLAMVASVAIAQPVPPNTPFSHSYSKIDNEYGLDKMVDKDGKTINYLVYQKSKILLQKTTVDSELDAKLAVFN